MVARTPTRLYHGHAIEVIWYLPHGGRYRQSMVMAARHLANSTSIHQEETQRVIQLLEKANPVTNGPIEMIPDDSFTYDEIKSICGKYTLFQRHRQE